jgi:hypothetical protein
VNDATNAQNDPMPPTLADQWSKPLANLKTVGNDSVVTGTDAANGNFTAASTDEAQAMAAALIAITDKQLLTTDFSSAGIALP